MAVALDILKKKTGFDDTMAQQALDVKNREGIEAFKQFVTKNKPVQPTAPVTPPTPPQTMQGVNNETFQVAPVNEQGLSTPVQSTQATTPVKSLIGTPGTPESLPSQLNSTDQATIDRMTAEGRFGTTPEVKPTPVKTEAPIDYTQAKGREQEIITNLESFKTKGMTPEQIMQASDYQNATPEKKALIEPYLKTTQPTASGMFNAIIARQDIPDEQKTSTAFKIAQNRYTKANLYASMTPAQVSQAMTDVKLIEGSQAYEDLKLLNPKLVKDVENLRVVNGSKPNIFTYSNNPDGTPVKTNNLETQFAEDYLGDYGEFLKSLFTVQSPEQIRSAIYTPDVQQAQEKATEIELRMNEIEKNMDSVDDDVDKEMAGSGATSSRIALEKASRKEKFQNQYNAELKNYTTYANKANNLITQNTASHKKSQEQKEAQQNALALAGGKIFENQMNIAQEDRAMQNSLALSQMQFDQKIKQEAEILKTPELAIPNTIKKYEDLGIMGMLSAEQHLAEYTKQNAKYGTTLGEYISQMQKDFQSKDSYKAKFAPKADATPFQIANLGDGKAIMYNQATGSYNVIGGSGQPVTTQQIPSIVEECRTTGSCGQGVNDYLQKLGDTRVFGNTYADKQAKINSSEPVVGGIAVWQPTGKMAQPEYGHVGIVSAVNGDQVTITDWNWNGDNKQTTHTVPLSSIQANGGGFYVPKTQGQGTFTATEEAWANSIMNKTAKISDITNKDGVDKSKVLQLIDQKSGGSTGAMQTNIQEGLEIVNSLINHPGFTDVIGVPSIFANPFGYSLPATSARDFKAKLERMEAIGFLNMIPQMQGMGALSNAEGSRLAQAYSQLSKTGVGEEEYKKELERLKTGMETALKRMGVDTETPTTTQNVTTGAGQTNDLDYSKYE